MKTYLLKRILLAIASFFIVVGTVMTLCYSLIDRKQIFNTDAAWKKLKHNEQKIYEQRQYYNFGYTDFLEAKDFVKEKYYAIDGDAYVANDDYQAAIKSINNKEEYYLNEDIAEFITTYTKKGYEVTYLEQIKKGANNIISKAYLYAAKDLNVFQRLGNYFSKIVSFETVNDVAKTENIGKRGIHWEWDKRSNMPALVGNGTTHKYLLYFDNKFPFIHINFMHINLGKSTSIYPGVDVQSVINTSQGEVKSTEQEYPSNVGTGIKNETGYDFHTVTYTYLSGEKSEDQIAMYGDDPYMTATQNTTGITIIQNSFIIGIISVFIAYLFGLPLGILMARKKDKLADKIGNLYIIFIMAVPSLAYIFIFSAIGTGLFKLPYKYANAQSKILAYVLPTISLAMPSIGGLMKWMRRYMIDQENSDYVKFARSQGLSEGEIFSKHIAPNAFIYLVHGIPGEILGCLTGAIITERVYGIPGIGNLLTNGINNFDNGIIIACTVFYTILSITSLILGDLLLAKYDPRVSFGGGKA